MAEFKLGRLRFVWKGAWVNSTEYVKDDIVRYGGKCYVCVAGHTSNSDLTGGFELDLAAHWELVNDGQSWGSNWTINTFYKVNDIVRYGGRSYIAKESHTSAATVALGLEADSLKWDLFNDGIAFVGVWSTPVRYKVNDIVSYGGQIYICNTYHTSTATFDVAKFTVFATGLQFEGSYSAGTTYQPGDVVTYGANTYVASQTTTGNLPTNVTYWSVITQGLINRGDYNNTSAYKKGDIVKYGAYNYVATQDTTGNAPTNVTYWSVLTAGVQWMNTYSGSTTYNKGDIVGYGGYTYVATQDTTGNAPTNGTYWNLVNKGYTLVGAYSGATAYKPGELVTYGGSVYAAKSETTGNAPSNETYWDTFTKGFEYKSTYSALTTYKVGDIVKYGARLYLTTTESVGNLPTNAGFFTLYSDGVRNGGTYADATEYLIGDIVRYGGRSYICVLGHTSNTATNIEPPNSTYWSLLSAGMYWKGSYSAVTEYELDDVVEYGTSSWISVANDNVGNQPDISPTKWNLVAQTGNLSPLFTTQGDLLRKGTTAVERLPIGTEGQKLVVANGLPVWENDSVTAKVFYVSPEGNDANNGSSLNRAFKTIAHACSVVTGPAVIKISSGTYTESLPMVVGAGVALVGDAQRNVVIQPAAGDEQKVMFKLSDNTLLNKLTMVGLTGFVDNTLGTIDASTVGGVFIAVNPASPITTKSPYIVECSSFSSGGVGAVVDGSIHASGFRSMLFHSYTCHNDGGVGIWVSNNGKAEVVSSFTYFCHYGYAASTGGQLRSLNGNNSYGTFGAIASGYDASETPVTASIYGSILKYQLVTGSFTPGEVVQGPSGTAVVLSQQAGVNTLYIKLSTGSFSQGDEIVGLTSGAVTTIDTDGVSNQNGYLMIVSGLTALPAQGDSITVASGGGTYVIQAVSEYTAIEDGYKPAGYAIIALAQEKLATSANGTGITIRSRYSKVRLTGHDFLNVGTGTKATTNYPGIPTQAPSQTNEIIENLPGRVFYVSTDQDGNFRVGDYFKVDQATGQATLNANAFDLSGLTSLRLGSIGAQIGATINEFSTDGTLQGNSDIAVPTEKAVKTYVDTNVNSLGVAFSIALGS